MPSDAGVIIRTRLRASKRTTFSTQTSLGYRNARSRSGQGTRTKEGRGRCGGATKNRTCWRSNRDLFAGTSSASSFPATELGTRRSGARKTGKTRCA